MNTPKFFCLPNLATDNVFVLEDPWNFKVSPEVLALPKEAYKARWKNPATKHCLFTMAEGQCPTAVVSGGNPAALLYGWAADYDGILTDSMIDMLLKKPQSKYAPAYWCKSQSGKLHLVWFFERPIAVSGNRHATELIKIIARKIKAVRWGVGYDPSCESVTQVLDIGSEWHQFREGAFIPAEEIILWDMALFEKSAKGLVEDVVDVPLDIVIAEIKKREWPQRPPLDLRIGTRCPRFWDAGADNTSAAQMTKDGFRVYTPHDSGFKSWRSLLGSEFCEAYTAKSMAPFFEDTTYCHTKDEYWRFFRNDTPPHYERRTEKVLRRDLIREARLSGKAGKGEDLSEVDIALYNISRRNAVNTVAPVLYRPTGRITVPVLGSVLNTSLVTVRRPAERLGIVTPEDLNKYPSCPQVYKNDPGLCQWDNPFAVEKFPHIHRLLTAFFMSSRAVYNQWDAADYPLHNERGVPFSQLSDPQLIYFLSWLSHFYVNAARQSRSPGRGQALVLAGPQGVGKSFITRFLIGELMGGMVDAEKFYLEGSRFNSGIVSFPVHVIDDKLGAKSQRARLQFTEALKVVVANAVLRYEAKFGSAVESIPWPGRIVILANEDAQSLSVLPDLDMSTRDKFMMLKAGGVKYRFGSDSENLVWLAEELPYFARFLLGWEIPATIRDTRFGVRAIQHNDMARASAENGLTQVALEVLEAVIAASAAKDSVDPGDAEGWAMIGNAVQVYKWISSTDPSLAREIVDSRTLQRCLLTLYKSGDYGVEYGEDRKWKIPYVLRNRKSTLTPNTGV